jgi:hypothetical protein
MCASPRPVFDWDVFRRTGYGPEAIDKDWNDGP